MALVGLLTWQKIAGPPGGVCLESTDTAMATNQKSSHKKTCGTLIAPYRRDDRVRTFLHPIANIVADKISRRFFEGLTRLLGGDLRNFALFGPRCYNLGGRQMREVLSSLRRTNIVSDKVPVDKKI